ncbi:uncharacterized protein LOC143452840 [Clavelina lepadiformis]|uniref:uncharacterized protein LOC143452840 n=1 Tax=Clavelina lepadiformis TaxID=159417 RepID=UPI004042AEF1
MSWNGLCSEIRNLGGHSIVYVYIRTAGNIWGEDLASERYKKLSIFELFTVLNSNGSSFRLRGEEFRPAAIMNNVITFEGATGSLAFAKNPKSALVVCGSAGSSNQCRCGVEYGLLYLQALRKV